MRNKEQGKKDGKGGNQVFILVGAFAALGYAVMVAVMFWEAIKGNVYPYKWMR